MQFPVKIIKHLRLVLTAFTLLLVVGLNNREVTTFAAAPETKTEHKLTTAAADRNGTVKQKVSFEATASSYVIWQLVALPHFWQTAFLKPLFSAIISYVPAGLISGFFRLFLATAILPNAP